MRRFFVPMAVLLLVLSTALPAFADATPSAVSGHIIGLDPGHGGDELGATYTYDDGRVLEEKWLNLAVADALKAKLEADGATVAMTRVGDQTVSLLQRCDIAAKGNAQVLISIHHNAVSDPSVDGTETYYSQPDDQVIAKATHDQLIGAFGLDDRGVKKSPGFTMTAKPKMPSTITEAFFVTNSGEADKLYGYINADGSIDVNSPVVQEEANALYQALVNYFTPSGSTGGHGNK